VPKELLEAKKQELKQEKASMFVRESKPGLIETSSKPRKPQPKHGNAAKPILPATETLNKLDSESDPTEGEAEAETGSAVADALSETLVLHPVVVKALLLDSWIHMFQKGAKVHRKNAPRHTRALAPQLHVAPRSMTDLSVGLHLHGGAIVHQAHPNPPQGPILHLAAGTAQTPRARRPVRAAAAMEDDAQADILEEVETETITSDP
jgi:hypothetical protein